jgi:putative Mg2+ transporter-C (MgtC) family protein
MDPHASMIVLRLSLAAAIGAVIGLDRELHGQAIGLRTLAIVAMGGAAAVLLLIGPNAAGPPPDALSRVLQGLLTGVGFLGAGVILRSPEDARVHGLATAATIWLTAVLGVACGLGAYLVIGAAVPWVLAILVCGGWLEGKIHGYRRRHGMGTAETD